MSFKSKVLAAAAALTLVGGAGAGALTASTANAATPSCGYGFAEACINIFNHQFGTHRHPNFLMDVWRQGQKVGQPIILFRASNTDPALDFTASDLTNANGSPMTVAEFQAIDPVFSPATLVQYGGNFVYEFQYSPYGVDSGLCVGIPSAPFQNEKVSLQGCGVTARTLWIQDSNDQTFFGGYVPLITGANTNFTHPFVLTYPQNGYPTDVPRPQLMVRELQTYSNFPNVYNNQLWGYTVGPIF